jgi:hypothetical protein
VVEVDSEKQVEIFLRTNVLGYDRHITGTASSGRLDGMSDDEMQSVQANREKGSQIIPSGNCFLDVQSFHLSQLHLRRI